MASLSGKIADIQVLRGIAISAVFIQHYASWLPLDLSGSSIKLDFLWIGVDLFFVISGFLIVTKLLSYERSDRWGIFKSFWISRFRRLMPAAAFWALFAVVVSFGLDPMGDNTFGRVGMAVLTSLTGVSNLYWSSCAQGHLVEALCAGKGPFGVYWSLSLEEQFYLIASALIIAGFRHLFILALVAVCAWNLTTDWTTSWSFGWSFRPYGLAIGSGLAFALWKWPDMMKKQIAVHDRLALATILLCVIVFLAIFYNPVTTCLASFCCGGLVWLARMDGCFSKTPVGWALHYLGERSYSFYLCHVAIIILVRELAIHLTGTASYVGAFQSWSLCIFTFGSTLAVSHLSYLHIENRFRYTGRLRTH